MWSDLRNDSSRHRTGPSRFTGPQQSDIPSRLRAKIAPAMLLAIILWTGASASTQLEDPEYLLNCIRSRATALLSEIPNYTCHEVVDRQYRASGRTALLPVDRVEVDVAFIGNRELFSRPGKQFEDEPLGEMVSGTIATGNFAAHAQNIFSGEPVSFKYAGPCNKDGHKAFRYDFVVAPENSHFLVKSGSAQRIVGYKGSLWADQQTFDLVSLQFKVEHIPSNIGLSYIEGRLHYKPVRIFNSIIPLPLHSDITVTDEERNSSINTTHLEGCRVFAADSQVSYDTPAEDARLQP